MVTESCQSPVKEPGTRPGRGALGCKQSLCLTLLSCIGKYDWFNNKVDYLMKMKPISTIEAHRQCNKVDYLIKKITHKHYHNVPSKHKACRVYAVYILIDSWSVDSCLRLHSN